MPLVLGVDSSTQSTKVEARDLRSGQLVAAGRAPHPATQPPRSEQHPDAWWSALGAALGAAGLPAGEPVAAISVAGQQHGLVALDAAGRPVRAALLWNDLRSAPEARDLVELLGADTWAIAAGSVPVASFTVTKLAWLARHQPAQLEAVDRLGLPHDWLTWRLCDHWVTDRGDASGTGWWSPAQGTYRPDLVAAALEVAGVDDPADHAVALAEGLPAVLGPVEPAGRLTGTAAAELGLSGAPAVAAGTGDNMAAALGTALARGDVAISIGTSGTAYAVSDEPTADPSGAVAGFADATGRYLPLVCTLNATQVTDAVARLLGVDHARLDHLALEAPPGADGLVLVPYLAGERTPDRPDATGTLSGLRTDVGRQHLARAAVEGVVCGLLDGLDALTAAGVDVGTGRLVLVGGGARSAAYRQVLADLSGRVVTVPEGDEHVALGACVQAAAVAEQTSPQSVATAWGLGRGLEVEPRLTADQRHGIRATYAEARG